MEGLPQQRPTLRDDCGLADMESIHLHGAEDVQRAASQIRQAADVMGAAAQCIQYALEQHQRFMTDWLDRVEAALKAFEEGSEGGQ